VGELVYSTPSMSTGTFQPRLLYVCFIVIFRLVSFLTSCSIDNPSPYPVPNYPTFNLCSGQIICCQTDARVTLEGYSARAGDPSFWRDPSFSSGNTAIRPAVVLSVEMDKWSSLWSIKVICIGRGVLSSADANVVPISSSPVNGSVTPTPTWPLSDSYCYIYPRPMKFFCYPGEVLLLCSRPETKRTNNLFRSNLLPLLGRSATPTSSSSNRDSTIIHSRKRYATTKNSTTTINSLSKSPL
jgi:hypothetical protein